MLGRMRMTVPDCIDIYRNFSSSIFGDTKSVRYSRLLFTKYKYDTPRFQEVLETVIRNNQVIVPGTISGRIMFPCDDCKVCQV